MSGRIQHAGQQQQRQRDRHARLRTSDPSWLMTMMIVPRLDRRARRKSAMTCREAHIHNRNHATTNYKVLAQGKIDHHVHPATFTPLP